MKIFTTILFIGLAQGLFLAFILLYSSRKKTQSKRYLALLIFAFVIVLLNQLFIETQTINNLQLYFEFANLVPLLVGPLLYLYTASLIAEMNLSFKAPKRPWIHTIPFVTFLLLFAGLYFITGYQTVIRNPIGDMPWQTTLLGSVKGIHIFSYIIFALYTRNKYIGYAQVKRTKGARLNLRWLTIFLNIFLVAWLFGLLDFVFGHFKFTSHPIWEILPNALLILILYLIAYVAIKYPIFSFSQEENEMDKYFTSSLSSADKTRIAGAIEEAMRLHKSYLELELKLDILAEQVNIPKHHISQTLNEHMNYSFQDFVNFYRIEEAKRLLCDPSHQHKTVLALAFEAGFNSKAVFNRVFKQATGLTPSVFRKQKIAQSS